MTKFDYAVWAFLLILGIAFWSTGNNTATVVCAVGGILYKAIKERKHGDGK